jgi:hypothetical protein
MGNAVISANAGARPCALETQIKRYHRSYRRRLRKLVRQSSRLGDLTFTFPAAAFALVSGHGSPDQRGEAVRMVVDGRSLQDIAAVLALAGWTRRLPPEAFRRPLGQLPDDQRFARKVTGRIPADPEATTAWLQAIEAGIEVADEDFALWLAGLRIYGRPDLFEVPVRPLGLYAWFSRQEDVRGRRLMEKPWHAQLRYAAAVQQTQSWFDRVVADLTRADQKRGPGRYSRRRREHGYTFVPLVTAEDLREEGRIMNNCVGSYAGMVANRECAIFSIRRGAFRAATLEVRWDRYGNHGPWIAQIEAAGNTAAPETVVAAARQWVSEQDEFVHVSHVRSGRLTMDATRWKALWLPYVTAKGGKQLPLERPDQQVLANLFADIERLARIARYA